MLVDSIRLGHTPAPRNPHFANLHGETLRSGALGPVLGLTAIAAVLEGFALVVVSPFYLPIYLFTRIVGRRPWIVSAHRLGSRHHREWTVQGWKATSAVIDEVISNLQHQRTLRPQHTEQSGPIVGFREWVR
jgi:hypothetical protein